MRDNKADQNYGYYSYKLAKAFETLEAMREAEAKEEEKQAAKTKAALERKTDAAVVETAYKKLTEATKERKIKIADAQKQYLKEQAELKKKYKAQLAEIEKEIDEANDAYTNALKKFTEKHGDFHTTFKDGDSTVTISNSISSDFKDFWDTLFDALLKY